MQQAIVKHLGTDANYATMASLIDYLENRIEISDLSNVCDIDIRSHIITFIKNGKENQ